MTASQITLVNAVGGGDVQAELDLGELFKSIDTAICRYDPEHHPSLYLKFDEGGATILVFRTGKYNIAGAKSVDELFATHEEFIRELSDIGIEVSETDSSFELRNLVFVSDLDTEFDLTKLSVGLGMEHSEYEPEQFPGIHFHPPEGQGLFLIFRTGKIILTGVKDTETAETSFMMLRKRLKTIGAI